MFALFLQRCKIAFCFLSILSGFHFATPAIQAQKLPWESDPDCSSITTDGVAAVTCGTSTANPPTENYSMGMMLVRNVVPAGRELVDVPQYHHPSWHVDVIGNVFGVTMDNCGNTYVTASSNYPSEFRSGTTVHPAILKYGSISSSKVEAGGTIYKIDGVTGQASAFATLPQLATTITHSSCISAIEFVRSDTGPGLGNIAYHSGNDQFYVTNFEDGRIYRIDRNGVILDSYDPLEYDTGYPAGVPADISEIPYGVAVSPDGSKLFFGTAEVFDFGNATLDPPARVYSIGLESDGKFEGSQNNDALPAGATWTNYVGDETVQFELPFPLGGSGTASRIISDIEFLPSGEMFVGTRTICNLNIHSAYNHLSQAYVLAENGGVFVEVGELRTGYFQKFFQGLECYGGVSYYKDSKGDVDYVVSSADMLNGLGPHGIHVSDEGNFNNGAVITPAAIISYGGISDDGDPKGIGGDVYVFKNCGCKFCKCIGDMNRDGSVDLLDVGPFVDGLNSGVFDPCGDINGDGAFDLLDVGPFVDLLTNGGGGCGGNLLGNSDELNPDASSVLEQGSKSEQ